MFKFFQKPAIVQGWNFFKKGLEEVISIAHQHRYKILVISMATLAYANKDEVTDLYNEIVSNLFSECVSCCNEKFLESVSALEDRLNLEFSAQSHSPAFYQYAKTTCNEICNNLMDSNEFAVVRESIMEMARLGKNSIDYFEVENKILNILNFPKAFETFFSGALTKN